MDDLKRKARSQGIWNMFLPKNHFKDGPQFTNVEYGLMAEQLGKSTIASEVCQDHTWTQNNDTAGADGLSLFPL